MSLKQLDDRYRTIDRALGAMRDDGTDTTEAYASLLRECLDLSRQRLKASGVQVRIMRATGE